MTSDVLNQIEEGIRRGDVVPYLGPGALAGVTNVATGAPIPATSDELILAMNNGSPMAPRLMYEFPRAAMNVELKRGRSYLNRFLNTTYGETVWTESPLHRWLFELGAPYIVDVNRDTGLQKLYAATPHTLIVGLARIAGTDFRFRLYSHDGERYRAATEDGIDPDVPILFKPLGTPLPQADYIASDADFVDYITELMGGFGIPAFLKRLRIGKQYALLGLRLQRDTERMVMSDIIYGAGKPAGWALIPDPNDKERRFCSRLGLDIVQADAAELLREPSAA
ncbi:MAG: SIR2 family protein [Rhodocyclaceae bacterium]